VSDSHSLLRNRALPPLNALRAFEACARLGSTVAAAAELRVTHGAISKQVSQLENWLGLALFNRGGVRLAPTPAGAQYAAVLSHTFDALQRATDDVTVSEAGQSAPALVRVSTTSSFAALWLIPRLAAFRARHRGIEVWVSETRALVQLGVPGGPEVALRVGKGPWPGVRAERLMDDSVVPVCAPSLAARLHAPAELAGATLIHDEDPRLSWPEWLAAAGLGRPRWGHRGPRLADGALILQAARAGQGVALSRRRLAAGQLRSGTLVQPFGPDLPLGPSYWLVLPPRGTPLSAAASAFAGWVRDVVRTEVPSGGRPAVR
jgi:LysR family glycine cleavage system transcriptional activator